MSTLIGRSGFHPASARLPNAAKASSARQAARGKARSLRIAFYSVYIALLMVAPTLAATPARALGVAPESALITTWLVINSFAALLLLTAAREQPAALIIVVGLSAYILISATWSAAPETSLGYGSTLIGVLCVAYLMSVDMDMRGILTVFARVTVALAVVGLVLYLLRIDVAIYVDAANRANIVGTDPFKGVFPHKIVAGYYAATGIVAVVATTRRTLPRILGVASLVLVIVLTSSSTALVLLPFSVAIYLLTRRALDKGMRARAWIASLLATAAVGGLLMWWTWSDVLGLLSRDATLTGRTLLWDWGLRTWAERPIFGWGYGAYFETPQAAAVAWTIPEFRSWDVPHFHQTYIQTAVDFGLIGLIFLVVAIWKVLVRSYSQSAVTGNAVAAGSFAITLTATAAGFVMYLLPSYAYTEVVPLLLFAWFFTSSAIARNQRRSAPVRRGQRRRRSLPKRA